MPLLSAIERREPRGIGREGGKGLAPLERPFRRLDHLQSVSIALAEVSTNGNEYVQMEGYAFYRRNIAPTVRDGTVTKVFEIPPREVIGATESVADVGATAHLAGAPVLGPAADQLTPFGTAPVPGVSNPAANALPNMANAVGTEAQVVAGINTHGACVVRFVKTAAGNNGVWAGGAQVILTAGEGTSPDVGPRALKIRSKISDSVATNNATIAAVGIVAPSFADATRAWATYMEKHAEICHPPP